VTAKFWFLNRKFWFLNRTFWFLNRVFWFLKRATISEAHTWRIHAHSTKGFDWISLSITAFVVAIPLRESKCESVIYPPWSKAGSVLHGKYSKLD
jgi:hypothetical protein